MSCISVDTCVSNIAVAHLCLGHPAAALVRCLPYTALPSPYSRIGRRQCCLVSLAYLPPSRKQMAQGELSKIKISQRRFERQRLWYNLRCFWCASISKRHLGNWLINLGIIVSTRLSLLNQKMSFMVKSEMNAQCAIIATEWPLLGDSIFVMFLHRCSEKDFLGR